MKYSYKLRLNKHRVRRDGTAALFFQVIIDRRKTTLALDLYWPATHFDDDKSEILPRSKGDKLHEDYCRQIERRAGEINEVFIWARLAKVELTIELFTRELACSASRDDFIAFWSREADERFEKGLISKPTHTCHKSSLQTLKDYCGQLPFNTLNKKLLTEYKAWLYRHPDINSGNTVWKKLRDMRTYCNAAIGAGYFFDYPFKGFAMPATESRLEFLGEQEFLALRDHFYSDELKPAHLVTLRAFLFACYTGLRISDLKRVSWKEVRGKVLTFKPLKRTRDIVPLISVPLHPSAMKLIPEQRGVLIPTIAEQNMNELIKEVAAKLGLSQAVSFHWARHTFATRFLRHGGRLEVLQQLLGHKKIETTMIYVHIDDDRKREEINLLPE
ncbi:Tyrosine recombinase xerC [Fibrella aestuarina BUZ 2]|uniref:Tyrosine recombinase xerC n=1 Tax=Fibrella aestuarina BUZ 2 TaxID=1166018 RepID=I0K870_9BACT|nr:site-specific integrase [Fibrella aestuarina]CCH00323.1 Tyrosine recombinase xerC [Fibrella aestuarina BUZ 2]